MAAALAMVAVVVAACSGGPILANPPLDYASLPPPTTAPVRPPDPVPVVLPRDDGPHDRLTEWWYYTGHLETAAGRRFGFEAVIFRAERGDVPVTWASHVALTDEAGGRFLYGQRSEIGPQVDRSPRDADGEPAGFDLAVGGPFTPSIEGRLDPSATPWRLAGSGGRDVIEAALSPDEAAVAGGGFGLRLDLELARPKQPAVLHDGDGWVEFGPAGGSYYYSRTRLAAAGELTLDGEAMAVEGIAWFDHQWGDFISVGGGGWDWFAVNLADGTDLTVSLVYDAAGQVVLSYGTLVGADGRARHLGDGEVRAAARDAWTSPATGRTYPVGWRLEVPGEALVIDLEPTLLDQELDTRPTTGVAYWEGSQLVEANRAGMPLGGEAYVEITRYGP